MSRSYVLAFYFIWSKYFHNTQKIYLEKLFFIISSFHLNFYVLQFEFFSKMIWNQQKLPQKIFYLNFDFTLELFKDFCLENKYFDQVFDLKTFRCSRLILIRSQIVYLALCLPWKNHAKQMTLERCLRIHRSV